MTIEIRTLGPKDAAVLERVAPDVFDGPVDSHFCAEFLSDSRHHMVVALDDGTVVGMASAVDYVHPDKPRELWVNEVGVAPTHRRLGIARRLLEALFLCGRERGCREAWVGTEHTNVAARALYAGIGGHDESFVLYSFQIEEG